LFMHVHFWPGNYVAIAGLQTRVKSARFLASGKKIDFQQDPYRVRLTSLPEEAPDHQVTTLALECDAEPTQDNIFVREEKASRRCLKGSNKEPQAIKGRVPLRVKYQHPFAQRTGGCYSTLVCSRRLFVND